MMLVFHSVKYFYNIQDCYMQKKLTSGAGMISINNKVQHSSYWKVQLFDQSSSL